MASGSGVVGCGTISRERLENLTRAAGLRPLPAA